jgi:hypothetical protein
LFSRTVTIWRFNDFNVVEAGAEIFSTKRINPLGDNAAEILPNNAASKWISSATIKWYPSDNDAFPILNSTTSISNDDNLLCSTLTGLFDRTV